MPLQNISASFVSLNFKVTSIIGDAYARGSQSQIINDGDMSTNSHYSKSLISAMALEGETLLPLLAENLFEYVFDVLQSA